MYIRKYKLNNSYTTYVVIENEENEPMRTENEIYKDKKTLEWVRGSEVNHYFHGKGVICDIRSNEVMVRFGKSKLFPKIKNYIVTFAYSTKPNQIEGLTLSY